MTREEYVRILLTVMAAALVIAIPAAKKLLQPELFPGTVMHIIINVLIWLLLFVYLPYRFAA